jgi:predicted phage terminase large subunit-like protein
MIMQGLSRRLALEVYAQTLAGGDKEELRRLCREDLFFLLFIGCKRKDINHDWIYERCREVEADRDGRLDLWARYHYKSSIITFGLTVQDILRDPEETVGIFSHTRPIAKKFLHQIKYEFESNEFLKELFSDILYGKPESESPRWSLNDGIIVKRRGNPKEATVEAWGLVDGQPTGSHFSLMVYDDVVTLGSVTTSEMIEKTNDALSMSLNLEGKIDGREPRKRFVGTHYHMADTYKMIIDRQIARPRYNYPTTLGREDIDVVGEGVLLTREELIKKRRELGVYVYASQMLLNPAADKSQGFRAEWIKWYEGRLGRMNKYMLVDGASSKKKDSDYTVIVVVGLGEDGNYYLVDGVRDRMNLTQRCEAVMRLHRQHRPLKVGYEQYGMMADIEHIRYVQSQDGYRFNIDELGGSMSKEDRIKRLVPIFENGRFYLPRKLFFVNVSGEVEDFINLFIEKEYKEFPVSTHDDMLDAVSRVVDERLGAKFPTVSVGGMTDGQMGANKLQREWHPLDRLDGNNNTTTDDRLVTHSGMDWKEAMRIRMGL